MTEAGGKRGDKTKSRVVSDPRDRDRPRTDAPASAFGGTAQTPRRHPSPHARSASVVESIVYESATPKRCGTASVRPGVIATKKGGSSTRMVSPSATIGITQSDARMKPLVTSTNALDVEADCMALKTAVSLRRHSPKTPLRADQWETSLRSSRLLSTYSLIPEFIRFGAHAGIPHILRSHNPLNHESTETLSHVFVDIIQAEFNKGRYLGPFTKAQLELEIGPFQSSPLSLVPKPGKPGKYRLVQNLSHPHTNFPVPSINAHLNSDDFPCTWGTFRTVCTLIRSLPQGSQAAVRDIAEAYRIIPLHESQWAGVAVRISNNPERYALNTCNSFGCATAGGLFGMFGDALADLLRAKGIGPILKWVDDFLFIRIPQVDIPTYNHWGQGVKYPAGTLRRHGVHRHKVITMCPPIKNRPHFE